MELDITTEKDEKGFPLETVAAIGSGVLTVAAGVTIGLLAASTAGVLFAILAGYGAAEFIAGLVLLLIKPLFDKEAA